MDGTIYLDETWIDGAREFLAKVEETGRKYCFMTNNSSKNAAVYVEKLHRMGLDIDPQKQLITSGHATIDYLKKHYPGQKIYLFGNRVLMDEFEEGGILLEEEHPDLVVTAFDTSFDYPKLCKLCDFVRSGMPFIGTHTRTSTVRPKQALSRTSDLSMPISTPQPDACRTGSSENRIRKSSTIP